MSKTKVIGIVVGCVVLAGVAGGGVYAKTRGSQNKVAATEVTGQVAGAATSPTPLTPGDNSSSSISLNQTFDTPEAGGLSVTSNSSANSATQAAGTQQQAGNTPSSTSGSSSGQNNPFDPTTFAQYDKYLKEQKALFGEAQAGTGTALTANHKAAVLYRGWLTNGKMFDESRTGSDGKMQPFIFTLGAHQVIPGWEQALEGMKVGAVRLVVVPPSAGYGATAQNGIPGNSVLVFQVQLVDVQ